MDYGVFFCVKKIRGALTHIIVLQFMIKSNLIIEWDSLCVLKKLPSNVIWIIITSPPYNAWHDYDNYNDNREMVDYLSNMKEIFLECFRVLEDWWRICVNVPFAIKNRKTKEVNFISHHIANLLNDIWFKDFERITWHKGSSLEHFQGNNTAWWSRKSPSCPSFRPMGEAVMVFYKNNRQHVWNKDKIDITSEEFKWWTKNSWYFDEKSNKYYDWVMCIPNTAKKWEHPAPYPVELVERLLKLYSYTDDIVLDPFNWIWTTTLASQNLWRNYIWIDLSKKYCDIAASKLKNCNRAVINLDTSGLTNPSTNNNSLNCVFPYKESFSPNLVPYLIDKYHLKPESLMDPFLWTGSVFTNDIIKKCYWYDISPLAINISKVKLKKLKAGKVKKARAILESFSEKDIQKFDFPEREPYKKYVPKRKYDVVQSLIHLDYWDSDVQNFIKYIIISNLDSIFDYKRDGNWIKLRKSKISEDKVLEYLKNLVNEWLTLKTTFDSNNDKEIHIYEESVVSADIKDHADIIVTSPPYANMFDYFEVYKIELRTSWLIKSKNDRKKLKKSALRSNKNANLKVSDVIDNKLLNISNKKMFEKWVQKGTVVMVNNYFYDMKIVLWKMFNVLKKWWYMFIVVWNSFYWWVPIKTDEILIEEAKKLGFNFEELILSRKLSTSSQQMKIIKDEDKQYLRESIIVLRK